MRGNADASSAQASAPNSVSTPETLQASSTAQMRGTCSVSSEAWTKTDAPRIVPTTRAVAWGSFNERTSPASATPLHRSGPETGNQGPWTKMPAMKIDVFAHVLPPRYLEERNKRAGQRLATRYGKYFHANPGLTDLDVRFRSMDKYPDIVQLLTIAGPNLESVLEPKDAAECARIANDEMAEMVAKHPDRFCGACAALPMNDIDAALSEADRAIKDLRFRGVEIFTDHNGRPVDAPEIFPLYEKMAAYNLPILLHPCRTNTTPDYQGEEKSKYLIYTNFGWPYQTSLAMARLAFGGPLEKYPTLKIVTHHAGGMIPYFHKRVQLSWDFNEMRMGYRHDGQTLTRSPVDYYRMFYCDTAIQGNTPALMCAYDFFGADHMVFATDTPYDNQLGERVTRETIEGIEAMPIDAASKNKIYADNARRLFRLPV